MIFKEWKEIKLGDLFIANYGKSLTKKNRVEGKYNVYGSGGIVGTHKEKLVHGPGIVIGRKGTVGALYFEEDDYYPIDTVYYIEPSLKYDLKFLYYKLKTMNLDKLNTHSAVPGLNREHLYSQTTLIPDIIEQKKITKILSDLDKKIEINNKINKKLEEMAQAIFKQWFVDFEFPCIPENYKFSGAGKPSDFDKVCTYKRVGGLPIPDGHSWFVYVLLCEDETFYKGMTNDLYRRFYEHYTGIGAEWTKVHKPIKVIHYEKFNTQEEARKREEELKSGFGREWIKRQYEKYKKCLDTQEMSAGLPAHKTTNNSSFMTAGEMVESELGMIPKGWEVKLLQDLTLLIRDGTHNPPKRIENGIPLLTGVMFNDGIIDYSKATYISEENYKKIHRIYQPEENDIVLTKIGTIGKVAILRRKDIPITIHCNSALIRPNNLMTSIFMYLLFKSDSFQNELRKRKGQTVQEFINLRQLGQIPITIPNKVIIEKFDKIIHSIFNKIMILKDENIKITEIRDALLPKLMSGEIRIPLNNEYN